MRRAGLISFLIPIVVTLVISLSALQAASGMEYPVLSEEVLSHIAAAVEKAVSEGKTPGAVVLIGQGDRIVYHRAFGHRSVEPERLPMTEDAIFDIASITKVVATSTAVMQLVEKGKISLDAPVSKYWSDFKKNGKGRITVRQLLTHYSGLRADLSLNPKWNGYKAAMKKIVAERPQYLPGSCYLYSDINFEVLGELVRRVSGENLDRYSVRHIFRPLGMKDTAFNPPAVKKSRIAATQYRNGRMICGEAHDPWCHRMGGIAGHAGLFSTAGDLSLFARMILNSGSLGGARILNPSTVEQMTKSQSPRGKARLRGLGWDIEARFASNGKDTSARAAISHLGYTGTGIWIDPETGTYIIVLTNRVHPSGSGDVKALRAEIKSIVSAALGASEGGPAAAGQPATNGAAGTGSGNAGICRVLTGIDVLSLDRFSALAGLRVGLITNHTGLDSSGNRTIDLLHHAPGVKLKTIFSPEHGLGGTSDAKVSSSRDLATGLPVHSLYGDVRRPTDRMLEGLDALVFDIQDAGVRFYTYISTMGYAMEAAAKKGIRFFVLDRPNPLNASMVQGPVSEPAMKSFTSYFPMPVRHGMTVGELADMFNEEYHIGAKLKVIPMRGFKRTYWFDETGLSWVNPSPNLRSLTEATLYPGVAMAEGANVSVGRGTPAPFEILGAPWIDAERLSSHLNLRGIPGVRFSPAEFTPDSSRYRNSLCRGIRITLTDRSVLDPALLGLEIVSALHILHPDEFRLDDTREILGQRLVDAVRDMKDAREIARGWQGDLDRFTALRSRYLLY